MQAPINFVFALQVDTSLGAGAASRVLDDAVVGLGAVGGRSLQVEPHGAVVALFDAVEPQPLRVAVELVRRFDDAGLRIAIASGVKERPWSGNQPRISDRSVAQARRLLELAHAGDVLVSSQLGSLLMLSAPELQPALAAVRLTPVDGPVVQAYRLEAGRFPG
jgi:class 3 adenylate cyclase